MSVGQGEQGRPPRRRPGWRRSGRAGAPRRRTRPGTAFPGRGEPVGQGRGRRVAVHREEDPPRLGRLGQRTRERLRGWREPTDVPAARRGERTEASRLPEVWRATAAWGRRPGAPPARAARGPGPRSAGGPGRRARGPAGPAAPAAAACARPVTLPATRPGSVPDPAGAGHGEGQTRRDRISP